MTIEYRIIENEIEIIRCYGVDEKIVIPEKINGFPVTMIAPYAFSDRKRQEENEVLVQEEESDRLFRDQFRLLAGAYVKEIVFPDSVKRIGNYIFYGCKNLKALSFSNLLTQIGSGAFTGCGRLGQLSVNMIIGKQSCVKEILEDLWQRMDVIFTYSKGQTVVKVVFPEHYEEAVENTPARILFTKHHGSGNDYRQCFYERTLDYEKYDRIFPLAAAREKIEVLIAIIFSRLLYPQQLSEKAKEKYVAFVKENITRILPVLLKGNAMEEIQCITRYHAWTEEGIDAAIEMASTSQKAEITGYLMNQKQREFKAKKKKYLL